MVGGHHQQRRVAGPAASAASAIAGAVLRATGSRISACGVRRRRQLRVDQRGVAGIGDDDRRGEARRRRRARAAVSCEHRLRRRSARSICLGRSGRRHRPQAGAGPARQDDGNDWRVGHGSVDTPYDRPLARPAASINPGSRRDCLRPSPYFCQFGRQRSISVGISYTQVGRRQTRDVQAVQTLCAARGAVAGVFRPRAAGVAAESAGWSARGRSAWRSSRCASAGRIWSPLRCARSRDDRGRGLWPRCAAIDALCRRAAAGGDLARRDFPVGHCIFLLPGTRLWRSNMLYAMGFSIAALVGSASCSARCSAARRSSGG